jgi:hypothetical protein
VKRLCLVFDCRGRQFGDPGTIVEFCHIPITIFIPVSNALVRLTLLSYDVITLFTVFNTFLIITSELVSFLNNK